MKNIKNALKIIFDPFSMEFEDSINFKMGVREYAKNSK